MNLDVGGQEIVAIPGDGVYPYVTQRRSGIPGMGAVDSSTMPSMTTASMPSMTATSEATTPPPQGAILPTDFMQRLPNIVEPSPVQVGTPCNSIDTWVGVHPLLAVGVLAAAALLIFRE